MPAQYLIRGHMAKPLFTSWRGGAGQRRRCLRVGTGRVGPAALVTATFLLNGTGFRQQIAQGYGGAMTPTGKLQA
jgi:hypothetical protein